jgi:hypothetical protein
LSNKKRLIWFISLLLIVLVSLSAIYDSLAGTRTENYVTNLTLTPKEINYLFVGDSHGSDDLDENTLNVGSYNISQPSDNFKDIYAKLLYLINLNTQINNLVIEIDPHLFANYRISQNNNEMILNYLDFKNSKKIYKVNILEYYLRKCPIISQKNRNFIFKASLKKIINLFESKQRFHTLTINKGIKNKLKSQNDEEALKRIMYHYSNGILDENEIKYYFTKIIEIAKDNNINIIGIRYPISKYYFLHSENQLFQNYITEIDSFIESHITTIYDYKTIFLEQDEYFANSDHLNEEGANHFSKILKNDIEKR